MHTQFVKDAWVEKKKKEEKKKTLPSSNLLLLISIVNIFITRAQRGCRLKEKSRSREVQTFDIDIDVCLLLPCCVVPLSIHRQQSS